MRDDECTTGPRQRSYNWWENSGLLGPEQAAAQRHEVPR